MQFVFSLAEHLFHRDGITDKHIVRLQQQCTVKINVRIRVKPFKSHHGGSPRKLFSGHGECGLVFPILILYPLDFFLIGSEERIREQFMVQQILMYSTRHGSRQPFISSRLREHPSPVQDYSFGSVISPDIQQTKASNKNVQKFTFHVLR